MKNDVEYLQKNVQHYCKCRDKQGRTALMYVAAVGAKESAQFLAKYEGGLCDHNGYSALMFSLLHRHDEITEMLAEKECQLFLSNGTTPLMMAAASGSSKLSLFLN